MAFVLDRVEVVVVKAWTAAVVVNDNTTALRIDTVFLHIIMIDFLLNYESWCQIFGCFFFLYQSTEFVESVCVRVCGKGESRGYNDDNAH